MGEKFENLNKFLRITNKSETLLLNEISKNLESKGKEIFKLGFGQSPFPPPDFVYDALKANNHKREYQNVQGLDNLLEAAAKFHSQLNDIEVHAKDIIIGPGSKTLIFTILKAFTKADVLLPTPSWVSYESHAKLCDHNIVWIPTTFENRWRVSPDALEACCKYRKDTSLPIVMILNYPGNPIGQSYDPEELERLAKVLKKYNVVVIADEIYGLLHHDGKHVSLAKYYPEGTIITSGLSKWCGVGGWRLGLAILPESLGQKFKDILIGTCSEVFSCASVPIQHAAAAAYSNLEQIQDYLNHQRRIYKLLGNYSRDKLVESGIKIHPPQGGFYLYLDFTNFEDKFEKHSIKTNQEMCSKILSDTGVAVLPGSAFGAEEDYFTARFAYVDFDGRKALKASQSVGLKNDIKEDFLFKHCPKVVEGVSRIKDWLEKL